MKPKLPKINIDFHTGLIFLFLPILVFTSLIYLNIDPPKAYAVEECDDEYPDSTGSGRFREERPENAEKRQACNKAFGERVSTGKSAQEICRGLNGGKLEGCRFGVQEAGGVSKDDLLKREAEAKCLSGIESVGGHAGVTINRTKRAACAEAYFDKKKNPGKTQNNICQGKDGHSLEGCREGVELADKGFLESKRPDAETAARNHCTAAIPTIGGHAGLARTREKRALCQQAYLEALNTNRSKAQVCRGKTGEEKNICEKAFDKGRQAKADGFVRPGGGGGGGGAEDNELTDCDLTASNPLSWILCPIIDAGANGTDWIFQNIIEPLLSDIPLSVDPRDEFFKAWQGFRLIANIILVIGMLGIVYSMARGDR